MVEVLQLLSPFQKHRRQSLYPILSAMGSPFAAVRSASTSDVVVPATRLPHAGLQLAAAHFQSQELGRGTRYRPVSPPRRPSLSSLRQLLKTYLFQRQLDL